MRSAGAGVGVVDSRGLMGGVLLLYLDLIEDAVIDRVEREVASRAQVYLR